MKMKKSYIRFVNNLVLLIGCKLQLKLQVSITSSTPGSAYTKITSRYSKNFQGTFVVNRQSTYVADRRRGPKIYIIFHLFSLYTTDLYLPDISISMMGTNQKPYIVQQENVYIGHRSSIVIISQICNRLKVFVSVKKSFKKIQILYVLQIQIFFWYV